MTLKANGILETNKVFIWIALVVGLLLLIPLFAMQVTSEVSWSVADFVVMGALMFGFASLFVLMVRRVSNYRLVIGLLVLLIFILVWAELGVGLFGTPWAGD